MLSFLKIAEWVASKELEDVLETCAELDGAMGDQSMREMDIGKSTLRDVLDELSNMFGANFKDLLFDPKSKGVRNDNVIFVNGVAYTHHLDSELKEGDEIALFPVVSGG